MMYHQKRNYLYYILGGVLLPLLLSCKNNTQEVRDFLAHRNMPLGLLKEVNHIYKDSGRITMKLYAHEIKDFANRKNHPYQEFPKGIHIVNFKSRTMDSTTVFGDYAINYENTALSKIKGNVRVINHKEKTRLETDLMYWDQTRGYYFTQSPFLLITYEIEKKDSIFVTKDVDTIAGVGFESREDLKLWEMQKTSGVILPKNED